MGDKEIISNSDNKQQQSYLFDDLIFREILTRLPIKSILRFESISKQWYSTLSSSSFANAHLVNSPFSRSYAPVDTLFIKCGNNFYLSTCDDDQIFGNFEDNLVKLDVDLDIEDNFFRLTGCCNGLICLTPAYDDYFIIWNPATRKVHKYESHGYFNRANFSDWSIVSRGFGYVSSVDDYKYVQIVNMCRGNGKVNIVLIFSLNEKKWRKIDFNNDQDRFILKEGAVQVNEKLYMTAFAGIDLGRVVIVSFDFESEKFEITKFKINSLDFLGLMGGCLSIINCNTHDGFMHIQESPTTMKSISLPKELSLDMSSEMIGFTKSGKFFVTTSFSDYDFWDWPSRTLWLVDTGTTPMQYSMLMIANEGINIARYVPSLVSPFPIQDLSHIILF